MSLNYIKEDIKSLLSDIQTRFNKIGDNDINYKDLIKIQKTLNEVDVLIKGGK